ncbi:ABC transporter ATP-binding protein [Mycetocola miduiensis]|uniref:ABC-2 type transport system ATP-binding protein n=1 Tax=Mycetocola miduiensis TaxID=995034 RepID=A0A1I5CVR0_9MICO|nr:ABC transporter ATP-binding protein [Mycetocola miduiensis]SFN91023.1 ABC-2 type transport system ATP-binding protein [Mycetocola miduiensis]
MAAIEVSGLRKSYGATAVVDTVSFSVDQGEVFALLGPNGAGKTTTVEILEGHRKADAGTIRVLGFDPASNPREFRERIGIVLQDAGFEEDFTVAELIRLQRRLYPRRLKVDDLMEQVGLTEKRNARVKTLSGGQRRRLDLALGLAGDPEVLFLDEPTTGFDPAARRHAWTLVESLREQGTTVLLTTHYLDEAEHLADRVAVMVSGRLLAVGTPAELTAHQRNVVISFRLPPGAAINSLPPLVRGVTADGAGWTLSTDEPTAALHALSTWALERRVELPALEVRRLSLEDVYLDLVGANNDGDEEREMHVRARDRS